MPAPGYTTYVAPDKYAQMAWVHGLGGRTPEERRERLFGAVDELLAAVGMPASLSELGVARGEFEAALPALADAAFADASLRTNPRMPLLSELVELLEAGWSGGS
jgi:acetaldehyde dehydrogenase/alcohol dehydrogenase